MAVNHSARPNLDASGKWKQIGSSKTTPVDQTKRKDVKVKLPKKENIIIIGSELDYDSFWLKMMFIGAACKFINDATKFRLADKKTILFIDKGYSHFEKLALENLKPSGFNIIPVRSISTITNHLNNSRDEYKVQDIAFFSHGLPGVIELNFMSVSSISFNSKELNNIKSDIFLSSGHIYSYACRTGVANRTNDFSKSDPQNSLAQLMANKFKVPVSAFYKRSFYGAVLRKKEDSENIVQQLASGKNEDCSNVVEIMPQHEALPHEGLGGFGAWREGTKDYALWRKTGGITLPTSANTPEGWPDSFTIFSPKNKI